MSAEAWARHAAVGLGSLLGGSLRAALAMMLPASSGLPLATLIANASGCALIGWYAGMMATAGPRHHGPLRQHLVMAGFCGGYTTFSLFSLETLALLRDGHGALAGGYLGLSLASWMLAVWAGYQLARRRASTERRTRT